MDPFRAIFGHSIADVRSIENKNEQHAKVRPWAKRRNNRKNTAGRKTQYVRFIDTSDPTNPKIVTRCIKHDSK